KSPLKSRLRADRTGPAPPFGNAPGSGSRHYGAAAKLARPALLRVLISCRRSRRPYLTASLVMSETLSSDDPYARTAQVYPKLPAELIARVGAYGAEELIRPGQTLFHRGDRRPDFFLVVEGEV